MFSAALTAGAGHLMGLGSPGARICALGLVICLLGCQPQVDKARPLPPLPAPAASQPRPVRPTFYVTVNRLTLRVCPGTDCSKISFLDLNAEVEKMEESKNWTQVKVKKDGTIGYVSSRYLSPRPVAVAKSAKKKAGQAKPRKAIRPPEAAGEKGEAGSLKEQPSDPFPKVM